MTTRFNFTTRGWMWFCVVFALAIGWGGSFRYFEWLDKNSVIVPTGVGINKGDVADPLNRTIEALNKERETCRELKYLILKIMNEQQLKAVKKARGEFKNGVRPSLDDIDVEFSWATE